MKVFKNDLNLTKFVQLFLTRRMIELGQKSLKNYNLEIMEGVFPQPIKNIRSEKVKIHQIHQIKHFQIMSYWVYMINVVSLERKSMVLFLLWVYLSIDWLLLFPPTLPTVPRVPLMMATVLVLFLFTLVLFGFVSKCSRGQALKFPHVWDKIYFLSSSSLQFRWMQSCKPPCMVGCLLSCCGKVQTYLDLARPLYSSLILLAGQ